MGRAELDPKRRYEINCEAQKLCSNNSGSLIATQRYSGMDEFSWTFGPQISLRQQLAPKLGIRSKLRYSIIDYKRADYRSGHKSTAEHRLSYSFADATV